VKTRLDSAPVQAPSLVRNQSLQRAAALLKALAESSEPSSIATLARSTGLPPATAARLLATLADVGLSERSPSERWLLGPAAARLSRAASPFARLAAESRPLLQRLADEIGESTMLAAARLAETEVIAQADPQRLLGATNWLAQPLTGLHALVPGKLLLASLDERALGRWLEGRDLEKFTETTLTTAAELDRDLATIRERGWAESVDELESGLTSIGIPVTPPDVYPALSIGTAGPSSRLSSRPREEILAPVREAARGLLAVLALDER
jgi:DNA-binding IclR family transcriptional regulator